MLTRQIRWLSAVTALGMFLVMLAGALVTNADASMGCGHDWPLCNGKFIPAHTLSSLIEYSHRAITGVVGLLVVAVTLAVFLDRRKRADLRWFAAATLFFTLLQAIMGAAAVMWNESSAVLALHFGISLLAVASTMLLAMAAGADGDALRLTGYIGGGTRKADYRPAAGFRRLVWVAIVYCYVVVYIGAFVRHTNSSGGCQGWPLCNGKLVPSLSGATGIVFGHRMAALLMLILVLWIYSTVRKRYSAVRDVSLTVRYILLLILLQIVSGAWVTLTVADANQFIFASLFHTLFVSILFGFLCYLGIRTSAAGK